MPLRLPDAFPCVGGPHVQGDRPITCLHRHDCLEIGYCHEGAGVFVVADKILPYAAGDAIVITDREDHLARSAVGTRSRWTFLYLDPARLVRGVADDRESLDCAPLAGPRFRNLFRPVDAPEITETILSLVREMEGGRPGHRAAVRGLAWALLARLHRFAPRTAPAPRSREAAGRIAPALQHLAAHYQDPVRMTELARLCHTSPASLRRWFLAAAGCSPQQYLARLRIQMAAALLADGAEGVLSISLAVGYPTLSSFNRKFKALMGATPSAWRRNRRTGG